MSGFWSMGGYARYVWPCFGFALRRAGVESLVGAPLPGCRTPEGAAYAGHGRECSRDDSAA